MIIGANSCGVDYDNGTAAQQWLSWNATCQTDGTIGYYIYTGNGDINTPAQCTSTGYAAAGTVIIAGYMKLSSLQDFMHFSTPGGYLHARTTVTGTIIIGGFESPVIPAIFGGWHYWEFKIKPSTTSTGLIEIRMDGMLIYSVNSISFGGGTTTNLVWFTNYMSLAALLILDTTGAAPFNNYIGEQRCTLLLPSSDSAVAWENDFGGTNFSKVNARVPPGDASFVHSVAVGTQDTYGFQDLPSDTSWIACIIPKTNAKKNVGTARTLVNVLKIGATEYPGTSYNVAAGQYIEYQPDIYQISPATGTLWGIAEVNALLMGPKITA